MNKIIQLALAQQVLEIVSKNINNSDYVSRTIENGRYVDDESYTGFQIIKEIMNTGLSPIILVEHKDRIAPLIEMVFSIDNDTPIVNYFSSLLTKEHIRQLDFQDIRDIYDKSAHDNQLLETLFKLGFDFPQGKLNELDRAISGNNEFFELCMQVKPDFKFTYKYEDGLTLDELLAEDIEHCKKNSVKDYYLNKRESLLVFLQKARSTEELKDDLMSSLTQKSSVANTMAKV